MGYCERKEPAIPYSTVTGVTFTYDDGSTKDDPANPAIGSILVDGKHITKDEFDATYNVVDKPPLA